jgi:diadenosine tetraphosphate (Ap4A) HIT family hydrolase
MTGWRVGYLIAPREFMPALTAMHGNFFISSNEFVQWAALAALREAQDESARFRRIFNERRGAMVAGLRSIGLGVGAPPTGAFYVLANARRFTSDSLAFAFEILERAHGRDARGRLRAQRGRLSPLLVRADARAEPGGDGPHRPLPVGAPVTSAACVMCDRCGGSGGELHIADLDLSRVLLHEDQFFPGYVLLVLRRHVTELYDLSATERATLMEEVSRVAQALARVFRPVKMNYELLGNLVPHIHWHGAANHRPAPRSPSGGGPPSGAGSRRPRRSGDTPGLAWSPLQIRYAWCTPGGPRHWWFVARAVLPRWRGFPRGAGGS